MQTQQIHEMALALRIVPQALAAVTAKVQAHFEGSAPSPAAVEAYLAALPVWTKIAMEHDAFDAMPATWRLTIGHEYAPPPPPVHANRPTMRPLTPQELAAHEAQATDEGWTWAEKRERARALQQTPAPQP